MGLNSMVGTHSLFSPYQKVFTIAILTRFKVRESWSQPRKNTFDSQREHYLHIYVSQIRLASPCPNNRHFTVQFFIQFDSKFSSNSPKLNFLPISPIKGKKKEKKMERRRNVWADRRNVYNPALATTVTKKMKIMILCWTRYF